MNRLKYLDGLKIFFCLWIVMNHYWDVLAHRDMSICYGFFSEKFYMRATVAIAFFFVLSGFLTSYTYKEKLHGNGMTVFAFLKKRFYGVYPMYFVTCSLGVIIALIQHQPVKLKDLILSYTMTSAGWITNKYPFGVSIWYVNVLFVCYVIYALATKYIKNDKLYYVFCFGMFLLGIFCLIKDAKIPFLFYINGRGYMNFFMGSLLYEMQNKVEKNSLRTLSYMGLLILFIVFIVYETTGHLNVFAYKDVTFPLAVYPTLIVAVNNIKILQKVFDNVVITRLSGLSTSIYFINYTVIICVKIVDERMNLSLDYSRAFMFYGIIGMVIVVSIFYKILVEDKLTQYVKKRFYTN